MCSSCEQPTSSLIHHIFKDISTIYNGWGGHCASSLTCSTGDFLRFFQNEHSGSPSDWWIGTKFIRKAEDLDTCLESYWSRNRGRCHCTVSLALSSKRKKSQSVQAFVTLLLWFQGWALRRQQRLRRPGQHQQGDIWSADGNLPHRPTLEVQIHFLPGFKKSNFEKETGNYSKFHLLIKGNKRLKRSFVC